jgi:hypothetical protein
VNSLFDFPVILPYSANLLSYSAILCAFLGLLQVFKGEAQDAQVLPIAVRPKNGSRPDEPTTF